jgi:hypothetical protein
VSRFGIDLDDHEQRKDLNIETLQDALEFILMANKYDAHKAAWEWMMEIRWRVGDQPRTSEQILRMDPTLDLERRRLLISATLTAQARRRLGSSLATSISAGELLNLARGLYEGAGSIEHAYHLRFEPAYPGVTAGPERVGRTSRLLLACNARDLDGTAIGVVFTTLIPGRPPQVSVAPAGASIPAVWRPPGDFH